MEEKAKAHVDHIHCSHQHDAYSSFNSTCKQFFRIKISIEEDDDVESYKISKDDRLILVSLKLPLQVYRDKVNGAWKNKDGPVN